MRHLEGIFSRKQPPLMRIYMHKIHTKMSGRQTICTFKIFNYRRTCTERKDKFDYLHWGLMSRQNQGSFNVTDLL